MSCAVYDPLSYGSCAGELAGSVAGSAFDSIARSFAQAASGATDWLWGQINAATAVSLDNAGFSTLIRIVVAIAGTVAVALFVIQMIASVLRREPGGIARGIRGLLVAFVAGGAAITVVDLLLAATDALSTGIVQTAVGTDPAGLGRLVLGSATTGVLVGMVTGSGGAAGALLLALAILAAVVVVYVALVVRKVLIVVTAVFAPLAFVGSLADITVSWTRRWIELTLALIFSKVILVLIFVAGYFMLVKGAGQAGSGATQAVTQVVAGSLVLAVAGFAPWLALKIVHFTGDHAQQLHALSASTVSGAATVGRMGQKAAPMARRAMSAVSRTGAPLAAPATESGSGFVAGGGGASGRVGGGARLAGVAPGSGLSQGRNGHPGPAGPPSAGDATAHGSAAGGKPSSGGGQASGPSAPGVSSRQPTAPTTGQPAAPPHVSDGSGARKAPSA